MLKLKLEAEKEIRLKSRFWIYTKEEMKFKFERSRILQNIWKFLGDCYDQRH